jgi:hypothetical protein
VCVDAFWSRYWKGERNMTEEPPINGSSVVPYVQLMAKYMLARAEWLATPVMCDSAARAQ